MGGCAALNCSNHSRNKFKMHKFPMDPERRHKWTISCGRDGWVPGPRAELCRAHFEESQFEQNRQDGWKKLKQTAVPTIFKYPDQSSVLSNKTIKENEHPKSDSLLQSYPNISKKAHFAESQFEQNREDGWKKLKQTAVPAIFKYPDQSSVLSNKTIKENEHPKFDSLLQSYPNISKKEEEQKSECELKIAILKKQNESLRDSVREKEMLLRIAILEKENESLRKAIQEKDKMLSSFLSEEQIASLLVDRQSIAYWNHESITEALKMRLNLGKKGYNYLRQTGYPLPSWSTINRRIQKMKLDILSEIGKNDIDEDDIDEDDICEDDISDNS